MDQPAIAALVVLGAAFVLFLAVRQVMLWYWRVDRGIALLEEIRDLLRAQQAVGRQPEGRDTRPPRAAEARTPPVVPIGPQMWCPHCQREVAPWVRGKETVCQVCGNTGLQALEPAR